MGSKAKWLKSVLPDEPVSVAAQMAVAGRLRQIWRALRAAATRELPPPEHVHILRVSVRRAIATLDCFDSLLPRRRSQRLRKQLKQVRRAANDARDYDVMIARFGNDDAKLCGDDRAALLDRLERLRRKAQRPIRQVREQLAAFDFKREAKRLVERIGWRADDDLPELTLAVAGRQAVHDEAERFFIAGASDLHDIMQLHQFRIQGKRLRYAMELFAGVCDPRIASELQPMVADLQERLGRINDHATAQLRFELWIEAWHDDQLSRPLERLASHERDAVLVGQAEFLEWWTAERAAEWRKRFADILEPPHVECVA
jgi:CHAD domain-containing protein